MYTQISRTKQGVKKMKKLMVAIVSAASAIFAFGDLPHGADFEAEGFVVGESFTNYLDKGDGAVSEGTLYWEASISGEEIGTIAEYTGTGRIGVDDVPDIYTNALTNAKYLQLDSGKNRLLRNIAEGGDAVPMSTGDGIYLDTLVKFSAASSLLDSDFESGDKLAIAYVGELDDGHCLSNFVVRAGFIGNELLPTNYYAYVPNTTIDVEGWHRLTIRTLTNIDGNGRVGFKIYLDGTNMVYDTNKPDFAQSAGFADDTHTIFPSAVETDVPNFNAISAVAFAGNGSIDDVVFTTETPKFIKETEPVVVTFTAEAGVTNITVEANSTSYVVDMNVSPLTVTLPARTTAFTVTAMIDEDEGYTLVSLAGGNSNPANISEYDGSTIAITTTRKNFSLFDANGDPISGTYTTLGAALAAQGVAKIQLAYDYDVTDADLYGGYINIDQSTTLDLNGKTLDGGVSVSDPLFMVNDGNFVIIDSVGGGKVVYDGPGIVYGATAYIGAVNDDLGPTFDGPLFLEGGEGNVIRGKFDETSNTAAGDEPAFLWEAYLGDGDSVESECTGPVAGYWVVAPKGGSEPTTYAISWTLTGGTTEAAAGDFEENDTIVFTAESGKTLSFVSIDGVEDSSAYGASSYTYTVGTADAVLVVTFTGSSYPSYIDDSTKQEKYDTWKSDMAAAGVDVGDGAAYEDAYLLNCKPAEVDAAKAAFKFTSISYDTTQEKWVVTYTDGYNERKYNGTVTVKQYSDVGCKTESSTGTFFRATLD